MPECDRCGEIFEELYPWEYTTEFGEEKKIMVCWDCTFELMNGRGDVDDPSYEILQARREEAYENDPINEPYPW